MIAQKLGKITNAETARLQMHILDTYPIKGTVPNYHGVYKRLSELPGIDNIPAKDFFNVAAAFLPPARKGTVSGAPLARDPWYKKYYLKKYPQLAEMDDVDLQLKRIREQNRIKSALGRR